MKREVLRLYLVTDRDCAGGRPLEDIVTEAVRGGVTAVQLREKTLCTRDFIAEARRLKEILTPRGVPLIINDRVDIALAVAADGVHLGQSDMDPADARAIMGPEAIIGLSVENMDELRLAGSRQVDYIGISPVFSTTTKTDTAAPFTLEGLREAVRLSQHPTVAIGGINSSNARAVMATGTDGIAVVSAIMAASDPYLAARTLKGLTL